MLPEPPLRRRQICIEFDWFITQSWHDIDKLMATHEPVSLTAIYASPRDDAPPELLELKQRLQNNLADIGLGLSTMTLIAYGSKPIDQPLRGVI